MTTTLGSASRSSVGPIGPSSSARVLGSMATRLRLTSSQNTCICTTWQGAYALNSEWRPCKPTRNKNKNPPEPAICNCLALRQAARHTTQLYDRHLAPEGLRTTQYSILSKLARLGRQSM